MNARVALHIGGLLGPFGGGVVSAMLPELSRSFAVSQGIAATSLTVYLLPFAIVMLVSGSLGERWGMSRSIRIAYAGYAVVALLAAFAPWFWLFQTSRALQGIANAFTTPLLLAKLAAVTPKERLGRALGTYGATQAIGQTSAPLVGGLAAEGSWQWAFVGLAAVAAGLAISPLPADSRDGAAQRPASLLDAWRISVLRTGGVAFVAWACLAGLPFLVSFRLDDAFSLSPGARGLVLTAYGVAGAIGARLTGGAVDRYGQRAVVCVGLLFAALAVASIGLVACLPAVAVAWAVGGVCAQLILVGIHATVLTGGPSGHGGTISVVTALRFLGMSAAPAAFTGLYRYDAALGFVLPAALLALTIPVVVVCWPQQSSG
ncbi:MFS transporter [Saccharopolyspora spinosa]|uniref:MFS family arabinose efflux permease n=1 Tax=Saccharopolyspora spinosa TaxID=60894 RepID=A0A2N3Y3K7_SACSN|nr:MFS transporter [Saccharopolyspora spinosa]PKW17484.1 putative MFS family arabinose efflux permease [Saccharopolyspora spinosa]